jgi:hypothetical protein
MVIDLRCHGDRALDAMGLCKENRTAEEIARLVDVTSNGNPERVGPDGIPDNSGAGFFPGDAAALRDGQIAAAIEVIHILEALQSASQAFVSAGINPNPSSIHLIGHGHSAPAAVLAAALVKMPIGTLELPAGGAGYGALARSGPDAVKEAFNASLPHGIDASRAADYLAKLEPGVLEAISIRKAGAIASMRYVRGLPAAHILLAHGHTAQYVPLDARQALIQALSLPADRVSEHQGDCDDFFLHSCRLGDSPGWIDGARRQLAAFMSSGGVTVLPPP